MSEFVQRFPGRMKLFIDGETLQDTINRAEFHGKWKTKRYAIMKKPRLYKFTIYMFDTNGDKDITTVRTLNIAGLADFQKVVDEQIREIEAANPDIIFDRYNSYIVVRV